MIKAWRKFDKKVGQMEQGTFNVWAASLMTVFILIPMFVIGLNKWMDLYLK